MLVFSVKDSGESGKVMAVICGDTYKSKDIIKAAGYKWDGDDWGIEITVAEKRSAFMKSVKAAYEEAQKSIPALNFDRNSWVRKINELYHP